MRALLACLERATDLPYASRTPLAGILAALTSLTLTDLLERCTSLVSLSVWLDALVICACSASSYAFLVILSELIFLKKNKNIKVVDRSTVRNFFCHPLNINKQAYIQHQLQSSQC